MEISREDAKEILKGYLPEYLKMQGYRIKRGNTSPCCSGGRYTKNSFHYNSKNNTVKCFACGFSGDIYDFVAMEYGLKTFNEAFEKTAQLLGFTLTSDRKSEGGAKLSSQKPIKPPVLEEKTEPETDRSGYLRWAERNNNFRYLEERGISRAVQKRFKIGYDPHWRNPKTVARWKEEGRDLSKLPASPRCIIPNGSTGYFARDTRKGLAGYEQNFAKQAIGRRRPFNIKALKRPGVFFVVEGEIDALSIIEAGFEGIGLCGAANVKSLVDELRKAPKGRKIVVMLDPDKAGRLNGEKLCNALKTLRIPHVDASRYIDQKDDPNAQLQENREKFIKNLKALASLFEKRKGKGEKMDTKTISEKLIETVKKEWFAKGPDENGCYFVKIPADYRDTNESLLPTAYSEKKSPELKDLLTDSIYEAHADYIYQCEAEILEKAGFDPFDIDYDEAEAIMHELIYFEPDYEHFMKDDMNLNLLIGTLYEQNSDFTTIKDYYHWGIEDAKYNGLTWLIKQQGYTAEDLKKVMEGEESSSKFLNSVCEELANHTYSMGCLTILVKSNLEEYCDIFKRDEKTKKLIPKELVLPKDIMLGIFNPWNGSGSMLEIKLEKDLVLPTELIWDCQIEGVKPGYTYSVDNVYGLIGSCWKESLGIRERNFTKILDRRIKDCASKAENMANARTETQHDQGLNR